MATKRRGRRAKKPVEIQEEVEWQSGNRVTVVIDDAPYHGTIAAIIDDKATVFFDDGDVLDIEQTRLTDGPEFDTNTEGDEDDELANSYPVEWRGTNWGVDVSGIRFWGCWRMTRFGQRQDINGWAIDIWARYNHKDYGVRSIHYTSGDPRENMRSLNADICAAINMFLYHQLNGSPETIDALRKKAEQPVLHISSLETVDRMLVQLREIRDTALRCGGQRIFSATGDTDGDPIVALKIDLTQQAMALEGKPIPGLTTGLMLDVVKDGEMTDSRRGGLSTQGSQESIEALLEALKNCTDKSQARRIRSTLRRMGHRGGNRSANSKPKKPTK